MQDAYSLVDASVGVENPGKGWRAEAYINNLTDERAQLHINRQDFFERVTTNRPRTMGVRVSYELN
jgi:outer membrane receptor protein involved in Fe transport